MNKKMSGLIVASAVCAFFASVGQAQEAHSKTDMPTAKKGGIMCQGHNSCQGKGGCKSEANSCKGQNSCAQHAFMSKSAAACKHSHGDVMKKAAGQKS